MTRTGNAGSTTKRARSAELAVSRAEGRNRLVARYTDLGWGREYLMLVARMVLGSLRSVELERPLLVSTSMPPLLKLLA